MSHIVCAIISITQARAEVNPFCDFLIIYYRRNYAELREERQVGLVVCPLP